MSPSKKPTRKSAKGGRTTSGSKAKKGATGRAKPAASSRKRKTAAGASRTGDYRTHWKAARDVDASDAARIEAFTTLGAAACDDPAVFEGIVKVVRDTTTAPRVRLAALAALQASSFSALNFAARRPAYMKLLRDVARDPEPAIRQRVLGYLAREKDGQAQRMLIEGLENPDKALVPPEKALQLLGYDIKSDAYAIARRIAKQPPNPQARREALRLLAADAKSAKLFEEIINDGKEPLELRQLSAVALQNLAPDVLQGYAKAIVLDANESPEMQATSLTALAQFGNDADLATDDSLMKRVQAIQKSKPGDAVRQSAAQFQGRYGPPDHEE
jgi:hypothetical protein